MKSIRLLFALIVLAISQFMLSAQPRPEHVCQVISNSNSSATSTSTCTPVFETHYNNAPIINMYVNVHIWNSNENLSNAALVNRVRQMIQVCNETFDNMQQNFRAAPNGQPAPRVEDAKIRLKLYSEITNSSDVNGGIWVYPRRMWTFDPDNGIGVIQYPGSFPEYTRRYNNVIDVLLVNFGTHIQDSQPTAHNTAYTAYGADYVVSSDLNAAFEADMLNGTTDQSNLIWRSIARALNHEIAHILFLQHTFECGYTQCGDIDVNGECGSWCSDFRLCGNINNAGFPKCPVTNRSICRYANSRNIMAYDWNQDAITQCQWERVYERAINTNATSIRDCPITANLTLTSSPGIDYRASQMITSTSTIAANRDVTYQAPSIIMNGGFQVPLGAAFLASPSTFPCCDPPASFHTSESELSLIEAKINSQKQTPYKVFPVPFTDKLTVQSTEFAKERGSLNVQLIDLNGKIVHQSIMEASAETTLSVNNIPDGQYFVKIKGEKESHTYRVIKMGN